MISAKSLLLLSVLSATPTAELWEFTAPWCGSCRQMSPVVQQLKASGVAVKQIQFDDNKQLAAQAQVRSLPCFLVVSQGRILRRHEGTASFGQLLGMLNQGTQDWSSLAAGQSANDTAAIVRGQTASADRNMFGRAVSAISDRIGKSRCQQCGASESCQCSTATGGDQRLPGTNMFAQAREYPVAEAQNHSLESVAFPGESPTGYAAPAATIARAEPAAIHHPPAPATAAGLDERAIQQAMSATVRLRVKDEEGVSLGTGTVIDVHDNEALVLTCGHIFRDSKGQGEITCDFFGANGVRNIPGKLISYDMRRDVGLVSFRPGVAVQPIPIGGTGCCPKQHDAVFSIGCNHGEDPTTNRNRILAVNRYHGPANIVVGGRPVDGRSGGGLFDATGRLIGVCNAADQEEDEGLYAALGPIHAELDSAGLSFIYRPRQPSVASAPEPAATRCTQSPARIFGSK